MVHGPGQGNLPEKTKVMARKRLKTDQLSTKVDIPISEFKNWSCLIRQKRVSVSQGETKSHPESRDFTERHPSPQFP